MCPRLILQITFNQEVLLLVIDKIFLGILIGLAAILGNFLIEKYKAKIAFTSELALESGKKKLEILGKIWTEFYAIGYKVTRIFFDNINIHREVVESLYPQYKGRVAEVTLSSDEIYSIKKSFVDRVGNKFDDEVKKLQQRCLDLKELISSNKYYFREETDHLYMRAVDLELYCESLEIFDYKVLKELADRIKKFEQDTTEICRRILSDYGKLV